MKTDRKKNVKFIVTNCEDRFTSQIITTYSNMFSFGLSSVISKVFVTTLSMCFFARKDLALPSKQIFTQIQHQKH